MVYVVYVVYVMYVVFIVKRPSLMTKASPNELLRMTQILASGIPSDGAVMENLRAACRGFSICQTGTVLEIRFST
jgi:hypothetical protein